MALAAFQSLAETTEVVQQLLHQVAVFDGKILSWALTIYYSLALPLVLYFWPLVAKKHLFFLFL